MLSLGVIGLFIALHFLHHFLNLNYYLNSLFLETRSTITTLHLLIKLRNCMTIFKQVKWIISRSVDLEGIKK